ncbi:hypothetical protein GCM10027189_25020 [Rufibacter soli]
MQVSKEFLEQLEGVLKQQEEKKEHEQLRRKVLSRILKMYGSEQKTLEYNKYILIESPQGSPQFYSYYFKDGVFYSTIIGLPTKNKYIYIKRGYVWQPDEDERRLMNKQHGNFLRKFRVGKILKDL